MSMCHRNNLKRGVYSMRGIFSFDSPLMRFLSKMADLIILNIFFLVTSIPLVTIGASLTAMHYVALRMAGGEEGTIYRDYFHSFKQNFRQATVIWLILLAFTLILAYDISSVWSGTGYISTAVKVLSVVACAAMAMILLYVFAILARFNNTVRGTLKNSVALALTHPGRTVSMFMLPFAGAVLTFYTLETFRWGFLAWLVIGFAGITFLNSFSLKKTFDEAIEASKACEDTEEDAEEPEEK